MREEPELHSWMMPCPCGRRNAGGIKIASISRRRSSASSTNYGCGSKFSDNFDGCRVSQGLPLAEGQGTGRFYVAILRMLTRAKALSIQPNTSKLVPTKATDAEVGGRLDRCE